MKILLIVFVFAFVPRYILAQSIEGTLLKDTNCTCEPSLAIEIATHSILYGVPAFWVWRDILDFRSGSDNYVNPMVFLVPPLIFWPMLTLSLPAEWTSGCETSYWNSVWIGFLAQSLTILVYGSIYDLGVSTNDHKFNVPKYLILGALPSAGSVLIYNLFLHPKKSSNQSMLLFPTIGGQNTASLNFVMRF